MAVPKLAGVLAINCFVLIQQMKLYVASIHCILSPNFTAGNYGEHRG